MSNADPWPEMELRAVTESAVDGPFGSALKTEHYVGSGGVRVVRLQNIGVGEFRDDDRVFISASYAKQLARHNVVSGDIIVASMGDETNPVARACRYPVHCEPGIVKADCFRLRIDSTIADSGFMCHLLNCSVIQARMARAAQGVTRDRINLGSLVRSIVPVPSMTEQRRIVEVLDSVDESIHSAERLLVKRDRARSGLLSDLLADDSHWEEIRLGGLLSENPKNGYSPKEVGHYSGTLMLGLGCLTTSGFVPRQLKNAPTGDPGLERAVLFEGDLLMSRANTRDLVGLVGRFCDVGARCVYPDLMMRLRCNETVDARFLEILLRAPSVRKQIRAHAVGTSESMVKISSAIVRALELKIPGREEQDRILARLSSCDEALCVMDLELKKLRKLKQGLMEDLLTGRVRVGDVERAGV